MQSPTSIPKQLGDFEILRELGRGGMGIVYEARQISLNRKVALKVLSSSLGLTAKAVMRFRREAEAAAKLHHTNIVPIYATGEHQGVHYYAMEIVDGPSLDQVIRHMREAGDSKPAVDDVESDADYRTSDSLPDWVAETIALEGPRSGSRFRSTASVTKSLSDSGVASGTKYFDAVATMIAGVAEALDHAHDQGVIHRDIKPANLLLGPEGRLSINDFGLARVLEQPGMTMSGEFVGTPRYMSPEQITAGRAPLDHRTDIYSLGATLYELLTLQPPFPGKTRDEVIAQILHKEPKAPRRLNRRVPTDLETICLKSIERDPDRRYQLAGQLAEDLRAYVSRFAISTKRAGIIAHTRKWIRRHPAIAASLLLIVTVSSVATWLGYRNYVNQLRIAEMEQQNERQLKENELRLERERAFSAAIASNWRQAELHVQKLGELGAPVSWIRMLNGQIALCQGNYDTALDELKLARELVDDDLVALALLTRAYFDSGDEIAYYLHVAELRGRRASTYDQHLFKGWALTWGHPDEAIVELECAYRENPLSLLVRSLLSHARCWHALDAGKLEDARAARDEANRLRSIMHNDPIPFSVQVLSTIIEANLLTESGEDDQARSLLNSLDVDAIQPSVLDQVDVRWARFQYFVHAGQAHRVKDEIKRAPPGNSGVYLALFFAAELYHQGSLSEAMDFYRIAADLGRESQCRFVEAFIRMDTGNRAEIIADFKEGISRRETSHYLIFDWCALRLLGDTTTDPRNLGQRLLKMGKERDLDASRLVLFNFIAGECNATDLEALTGESRRFDCEAYFALGVDALANGKRDDATKYFRQCERTGYFAFYNYFWSRAFAQRLESGQPWLEWLPTE